jgi:hypothetical protein
LLCCCCCSIKPRSCDPPTTADISAVGGSSSCSYRC